MNKKNIDSIQCGSRIKHARLLAGLSRRVLEEKFNLSASTVQSWEIERNPLSLKGATKLISIFKKSGLYCTMEWLLTGEGISPRLYNEININKKNQTEIDIQFSEEESISKEILCFQKTNNDSIVVNVIDDAMEPQYSLGDYVGGKRRYKEKIVSALGLNCIIQTINNDLLLRKLVTVSVNTDVTLTAINPNTTVTYPTLYNQSVLWVAPIIWHRKNNID